MVTAENVANVNSKHSHEQVVKLLHDSHHIITDIGPVEWAESKRYLDTHESPWPGKLDFGRTPFHKGVLECLREDHPARVIGVRKGVQIGFSTLVIENGVGYIMDQIPGNILYLAGTGKLAKDAVEVKIDGMIQSCNIGHLLGRNAKKKKGNSTGDTSERKDFAGGVMYIGSASHSELRQRSVKYGFIDDYDNFIAASEASGSTYDLIQARFNAYDDVKKVFFVTTPELKLTSNIDPVFEQGNQCYYFIPCPHCHEFIDYQWSVKIDEVNTAGMTWRVDNHGLLIPGSTEYICQKCGNAFDDKKKDQRNRDGDWKPTATPIDPTHYSFDINSLYAPTRMKSWEKWVIDYMKAFPEGKPINEASAKTFTNLCLAKSWEEIGKKPEAKLLIKNRRPYRPGTIPTKIIHEDGNVQIVLLTMAVDLGGYEDDARMDWQVIGWTSTGCQYSIDQGSIGTFKSGDKDNPDREKWNYYDETNSRSCWTQLRKLISKLYKTDLGKSLGLSACAIDSGFFTSMVNNFVSRQNFGGVMVFGVKGQSLDQFVRIDRDKRLYQKSHKQDHLYLVDHNAVKDMIYDNMLMKWNSKSDVDQPAGFMNFPSSRDGKYTEKEFFAHYEGEEKKTEKDKTGREVRMCWQKVSGRQNHYWDTEVYNHIAREVVKDIYCKHYKKENTWHWFVQIVTAARKK